MITITICAFFTLYSILVLSGFLKNHNEWDFKLIKDYLYSELEFGFRDVKSAHCGLVLAPFSWENGHRRIQFMGGIIIFNFTIGYCFTYFKACTRPSKAQEKPEEKVCI
jgi:hypothetical protein